MKPKQFRRHLRREATSAERILWFNLKDRKFHNLKFRRQHSIEKFVVDFYCDELKLIIEVDGGVHDNQGQANYDEFRDNVLKTKGYTIIRIDNASVIDYTEATLAFIYEEIEKLGVLNKS